MKLKSIIFEKQDLWLRKLAFELKSELRKAGFFIEKNNSFSGQDSEFAGKYLLFLASKIGFSVKNCFIVEKHSFSPKSSVI